MRQSLDGAISAGLFTLLSVICGGVIHCVVSSAYPLRMGLFVEQPISVIVR